MILLGPVCADDAGKSSEANEQDAPDERIGNGQWPSEGVGADMVGDDQYRVNRSDTTSAVEFGPDAKPQAITADITTTASANTASHLVFICVKSSHATR